MKFFLLTAILLNLILLVGCSLDSLRESRIDYTDELLALKAEKENFMTERKKLTDMVAEIAEKIKNGAVSPTDAQLLFAEVNKTRDRVSESISNVNAKISDMQDKAKKKSEETNVPWWMIMAGNALFTIFGIKKRTSFGLSEAGYKHNL